MACPSQWLRRWRKEDRWAYILSTDHSGAGDRPKGNVRGNVRERDCSHLSACISKLNAQDGGGVEGGTSQGTGFKDPL